MTWGFGVLGFWGFENLKDIVVSAVLGDDFNLTAI